MEEGRSSCVAKRPLYPVFEASEEGVEEENLEEVVHHVEKKRRLSVDQVRSLEKYFEQENKLEPERKLQLARELGLQPRQVAVWFQNRRARWKTKQLEKDYDSLKSSLDSLKGDYESLMQEKDRLQSEVTRLTGLLNSKSCTDAPAPPRIKVDVELVDTKEIESGITLNSSSDSDDSEIVDGESPRVMMQGGGGGGGGVENGAFQLHHHQHHHHQNNSNNGGGGDGGGVALDMDQLECHIPGQAYEDVVYCRIPKLEETSFLDLEESDQTISWWELP